MYFVFRIFLEISNFFYKNLKLFNINKYLCDVKFLGLNFDFYFIMICVVFIKIVFLERFMSSYVKSRYICLIF